MLAISGALECVHIWTLQEFWYAVAILIAAFIVHRILYAFYYSPLRNIPGPLVDRLTKRKLEFDTLCARMPDYGIAGMHKYGDIFVCQPQAVCISDPADIRVVLSSSSFLKSPYYKILQFTGLDSTICTRDPHMVSVKRRMFGPYFSTSYLNKLEPVVLEYGAKAIIDRWDTMLQSNPAGEVTVNYCVTFSLCTFNIVSRLVYGQDIAALDPRNPETSLKWMSDSTTYISLRALLKLLPMWTFKLVTWPWEHMFDQIAGYVQQSIDTRKKLLQSLKPSEKRPVDLLQALLDSQDPQSQAHLSDEQIHAESLLLLIGGIDPTAFTLTWTLHLFMLYPECYQKAVNEVRTQFPHCTTTSGIITFAMAKAKLPYLEACIYESLRLAPVPQMMIPRVVPEQGTFIKGHYLPPGTTIFSNVPGSQSSPEHWPDPHRYNPERFMDPQTKRKAIHSVFTFGYGNRTCMGKHLAWLDMVTILANLLCRFDFKIPAGYTQTGPNIIDKKTKCPKLMDKSKFISAKPANQDDCWVVVSKASQV
ncbi:hypothetical protein IWW42_004097 [Coemansia sp. RSA 1085]|nr:hypothetical protein IWW42_004097 [Coemansia sp. RSA 1085]